MKRETREYLAKTVTAMLCSMAAAAVVMMFMLIGADTLVRRHETTATEAHGQEPEDPPLPVYEWTPQEYAARDAVGEVHERVVALETEVFQLMLDAQMAWAESHPLVLIDGLIFIETAEITTFNGYDSFGEAITALDKTRIFWNWQTDYHEFIDPLAPVLHMPIADYVAWQFGNLFEARRKMLDAEAEWTSAKAQWEFAIEQIEMMNAEFE